MELLSTVENVFLWPYCHTDGDSTLSYNKGPETHRHLAWKEGKASGWNYSLCVSCFVFKLGAVAFPCNPDTQGKGWENA